MAALTLSALAFALPLRAAAQALTLVNAVNGGGSDSDTGQAVATDGSGNAVVTGFFFDSATFGSGASAVTLTSAGDADLFIARYAPNGTLLSAVSAGGSGRDEGLGVATDGSGNAVVTGFFNGNATFGSGASAVTLTSDGGDDLFVARYAPNGTLLGVTRAGGSGDELGRAVATDGDGNAVVAGSFQGIAHFGDGASARTLTSAGGQDIFVARYAPDGSLLNVVGAGSPDHDIGYGVATDKAGNAVVIGSFRGDVTFGAGTSAVTLTSTGGDDLFVARYASDGTLISAAHAGGIGPDVGFGVATDPNGNAVVTGDYFGPATFGLGAAAVTLPNTGGDDFFVARYAPNGTLLNAVRADGNGRAVATDSVGNAVVTGSYNGQATLGSGAAVVTLTSVGRFDVLVARYSLNGTLMSAASAGGLDFDYALGVATDRKGSAVVTGSFHDQAIFGSGASAVTLTSDGGSDDMFVTRYTVLRTVAVTDRTGTPSGFRLVGAAPNPFNPTTTLRFDLPTAATVQATVFNALGQSVRTVSGSFSAGANQALALDASGLPSGAYLVRLTAGMQTATVRVMLAK